MSYTYIGHSYEVTDYDPEYPEIKKEEPSMNAKQLANILADEVSIEDLILAKDGLSVLDAGFQELQIETPEWITDKLTLVSSEIINRNRAELQRRLKAAKARRAGLATVDEKRAALDAEIAALEQSL